MQNEVTPQDFTRVNSDVNGNPRYVCHFIKFLTFNEDEETDRYALAVKRAKKIGGKKFHNKQFGGGIVFQSYNLQTTCDSINELMHLILNPPAKVVKYPHPVFYYLVDNLKSCEDIAREYDEKAHNTITARLEWTLKQFRAEYCFPDNLKRYGNETNVFREWLMGLPSAFYVEFRNHAILDLAKKWGVLKDNATEREEDKLLNNWFNFAAVKFFQLCKKHGVK
jgi:hypothetical protein